MLRVTLDAKYERHRGSSVRLNPDSVSKYNFLTILVLHFPVFIFSSFSAALAVQAEECLYVVLECQKTTVVLIADSKARRDAWLQALRQLHGFRIYDVRYAYP